MSVAEARAWLRDAFERAGVASPEVDAAFLLEAATGIDRMRLLLEPARPLSQDERARLVALASRRAAREPLQHVLGRAPFYGLELIVAPGALVPRPETERLVELVLAALASAEQRDAQGPRVLDVGTGSGAIALALKGERPDLQVMATDVSEAALRVARRNARALRLDVRFVRSDLLASPRVATFAACADALVANLPYLPASDAASLPPEVVADPPIALFGGPDGLEVVRRLVRQARERLPRGALLALEVDPRNVASAAELVGTWRDRQVASDLNGRERFVLARR